MRTGAGFIILGVVLVAIVLGAVLTKLRDDACEDRGGRLVRTVAGNECEEPEGRRDAAARWRR